MLVTLVLTDKNVFSVQRATGTSQVRTSAEVLKGLDKIYTVHCALRGCGEVVCSRCSFFTCGWIFLYFLEQKVVMTSVVYGELGAGAGAVVIDSGRLCIREMLLVDE